MKANELAGPEGDIFNFHKIGDTVEGRVVYVGDGWEEMATKFGSMTFLRIGLIVNGEPAQVWPTKNSGQAKAIAAALQDAGLDELAPGQTLKLRFDEEIDTGKGNPFKKFRAKITPAPEGYEASAEVEDEAPF